MANFKTRARALDLLGRQQIAGIPTAINELLKNAHDAYADNVDIDYYIVTLENIIQMFSEEYWRKFDLVRIDSIENYNVESFNKIGADFNGKTSANSCLQWHFIDDALSKIVHNFS